MPGNPSGYTGSRAGSTWERSRVSGLAHILAVSGLHIGIVMGWVFFTVRLLLAAVAPLGENDDERSGQSGG